MPKVAPHMFQAAYVVADIDQAMRRWIDLGKVGPFFVFRHIKVEHTLYRGAPAALDFSSALAQSGSVQIELIQPHGDGPSAYRDAFEPGQEGFHHLGLLCKQYDAELARYLAAGCQPATQGMFGDLRFAYIDTRAQLGHMTELVEHVASIAAIIERVADAAADWDGRDPIREW